MGLLFRVATVAVAALFSCAWLWALIGMLRQSRGVAGKGKTIGWPNLIMTLGGCLFLIGIASEEPHRAYPIVILGVGVIVLLTGGVLRSREMRGRPADGTRS